MILLSAITAYLTRRFEKSGARGIRSLADITATALYSGCALARRGAVRADYSLGGVNAAKSLSRWWRKLHLFS
jgi:hypothetical protein